MAIRIVHVGRSAVVRRTETGRPRRRRSGVGRAAGSGLMSLLLLASAAMGSSATAGLVAGPPVVVDDTVVLAAWHPTSPGSWAPADTVDLDHPDPVPHGAAALPAPSVSALPPVAVDPDPAASESLPDLDAVLLGLSSSSQVLSSGFVRPVGGVPTSQFGPRYHPILHVWKLHSGLDFGAACGRPVVAAKAGTVTKSGPAGGNGTQVAIDHGNGLVTTYNHLSAYAATPGMSVAQGQIIGLVGTTGLSTGCHLHFEVILNGAFVDPAPYLLLAPAPVVTLPAAIPPVSATSLPTPTESLAATATPSTSTATTEPSAAEPSATEAPSVGPAPSATAEPTTAPPTQTIPTTIPSTTTIPTTSSMTEPTTATADPETAAIGRTPVVEQSLPAAAASEATASP